ncbi:hypothetical protein SLEP1_g6816 [Rubroshorea leprosula]|uniref:Uncharacterized protein n=1 Tax=Rubroshorea leprosula TaxID=152421 RepID=A0AAV5I2S5_9ROSI|nr:hypothetical protein SLEP1_g6816 [Rubroshorea leprosula]
MDSGYPSVHLFLAVVEEEYDHAVVASEELEYEVVSDVGVTASKQRKAKVPIPSKVKTIKEKETSKDNDNDESSWGDLNPESVTSNEGFDFIRILGDDKVLSKFEEAKRVEALVVNMEEALANLQVCRKILANEISVEKGKAKAVVGVSREKGKKVTEVISSNSNESNNDRSSFDDALSKSENGSEQRGKDVGFQGSIDINRAALEEFESDMGDATKKSISNKSKVDVGTPAMSSTKKAANPDEIEHYGQPSSTTAKSGEIEDSTMRLLKNLDEMNKDRDVSLARFGLVPMGGL